MKELSFAGFAAWQFSAQEAVLGKHNYIETEHLLIGICSLEKIRLSDAVNELDPRSQKILLAETAAIGEVLGSADIDAATLRRTIRRKLGIGDVERTEKIVHRSLACKEVFARAAELTGVGDEITCIHLLAAIIEQSTEIITSVLQEIGVKPNVLLETIMAKVSAPPVVAEAEKIKPQPEGTKVASEKTSFLDRFGRDLTQAARDGKLGPFVGRRQELLQIIQTLARRTKNNPVLVGEAGVGKTAVIEALAMRAAEGKDPQVLGGKRIIELNIGALVGGTKYRGEFEERLTQMLEELRTHPEVILFIDEIHNVVGAGRAEGSMDAANLIKPALARGELHCIGATTIMEYRRVIESDPALERRFEKIIINEPSPDETVEILKGLRSKWEDHHHVHISDQALQAAVELSVRFDADHQLPDKAIDLVDKAGAQTRIPFLSIFPPEKPTAEANGLNVKGVGGEITPLTIAQVLSEKTGVPLEVITGHLNGMERSHLLDLEKYLKDHIIGQDEAIETVCRRLLMAHSGLVKRRGPLAVFLFLGPTGVGKTETARLLTEFMFGNASDMIQLDMSEYMEPHSTAKLIGSPPGYIGHDEEGQLTGKLRTRPYTIVLLDEIEKAHPQVFDMFLQVFDDGHLTDAKGRTIDAHNTIFIMTSNISVDKHAPLGFLASDKPETVPIENVERIFRVEFINRIDEQVSFHSLTEAHVRKILRPLLDEINHNLQEKFDVTLEVTEEAEILLAHEGYDQKFGARELRRTVDRLIQVPLSKLILAGELTKNKHWQLTSNGEELLLAPSKKASKEKEKK
ncbi:MAG: ATP-dependent Clp protease ATP-binding subunit [Anaerolineaceae bacterium]